MPDPQLHSHVVISGAVREDERIEEFSERSREVARAAERFRARYGRAPKRGELRNLALENRCAKELTTRGDLQRVWGEAGRRHDFGPDEAVRLIVAPERPKVERSIEDRIEARLTEQHAVFHARDLYAVALEQSAGELAPEQALAVAREMVRDRRQSAHFSREDHDGSAPAHVIREVERSALDLTLSRAARERPWHARRGHADRRQGAGRRSSRHEHVR